jgi:YVTN family beta-propeller protein
MKSAVNSFLILAGALFLNAAAQEKGQLAIYLERMRPTEIQAELTIEAIRVQGQNSPIEVLPLVRMIGIGETARKQYLLAEAVVEVGHYQRLYLSVVTTVVSPDSDRVARWDYPQECEMPLDLAVLSGGAQAIFLGWQVTTSSDSAAPIISSFRQMHKKLPPRTALAYVSNEISGTVSLLDRQAGEVIGCVGVGQGPRGMALAPQSGLLFVANAQSHSISVIETATPQRRETIHLDFGDEPETLCLSPDERRLYVANRGSSTVAVVDPALRTVITKIPVGQEPVDIAADPETGMIWVVSSRSDAVQIMEPETFAITATLEAGLAPTALEFNPRQKSVYIANFNSAFVTEINTVGPAVAAQISAGRGVRDVVLDAFREVLYASVENRQAVIVLKPSLNLELAEIPLGQTPGRMALDPEGGYLYVCCPLSNTIQIIDKNGGHVERIAATGQKPYMVIFP